MTLLPLQHPARPARGHANSAKAHEDRGRYRGERGNETCGEFRLPASDCVEREPRVSVAQRFDIPQTGNVYIRHGKRFGQHFAFSAHGASPALFLRGIEARNPEPANHTIASSRPMVKEGSMQEFRA